MPINPHTGQPYTPRKWQAEALPIIGAALAKGDSPLTIAGTGAGKSVLQSELCRLTEYRAQPGECIVVTCPSQALVKQLSSTIADRVGADKVGVYYGRKKQPMRRVIVTCLPSLPGLTLALAQRDRRVRLLVCDEAHKTETEAIIEAVQALDARWRCGFTATPFRSADNEALSLWSCVPYRYTLGDAMRDGVLVPMRVYPWDGDGDGTTSTDEACISMIQRFTEGPGIVSATSIADAEAYAETLSEAGIPAQAVHSKMKAADVEAARDALEAGDLRCIVHVSLLVEGVDWPFLLWGCLRRPLRASVAFVQQIGRFLRTHPGKTKATILDPHDLMATDIGKAVTLGGDFAAQIGAWEQQIADAEAEREQRILDGPPEIKELPPPKAVEESTDWARDTLIALVVSGVIPASSIGPGEWRTRMASGPQQQTLQRMAKSFARFTPEPIHEALRILARPHASGRMQQGAVSDLITILRWVADQAPPGGWEARKDWPGPKWPDTLELPRLEAGALRAMRRDPETGRLTRA